MTVNKCNFWCCYLAEKLAFWALLPNERSYAAKIGMCSRLAAMRAESAGTVNAIAANFAVIPPSPPNNVELGGLNRRYTSKISVDVR